MEAPWRRYVEEWTREDGHTGERTTRRRVVEYRRITDPLRRAIRAIEETSKHTTPFTVSRKDGAPMSEGEQATVELILFRAFVALMVADVASRLAKEKAHGRE